MVKHCNFFFFWKESLVKTERRRSGRNYDDAWYTDKKKEQVTACLL